MITQLLRKSLSLALLLTFILVASLIVEAQGRRGSGSSGALGAPHTPGGGQRAGDARVKSALNFLSARNLMRNFHWRRAVKPTPKTT